MNTASPRVLILLLSAIWSLPSLAGEVFELEAVEVVSTATRTTQPIKGVSASVQVISRQEIEKGGAQTLKDVFSNTPGLTLQYGTFPAASAASKSSVSLRGVGASGTLWLLDGRRLAGEVKNPYDMERIPASSIERIEIVKGPMSALYGADAVGGVVNIITKQPKDGETHGEASISHGSNTDGDGGNSNASASIRGGKGKVRYSLNTSHQTSDPYSETETTKTTLGATPTPPPLRNVKGSYNVPVTYREAATVSTVGGRVEMDATDKTTVGLEVNWFDEEREGIYRSSFHPTGFSPAPGRQVPAYNVPTRSRDANTRTDVAVDVKHDASENLELKGRVYQSDYEKRNRTTITEFADFAYTSEAASSASGMDADVKVKAVETSATWYSPNNKHVVTGGLELRDEDRRATVFTQGSDMTPRGVGSKAAFVQDEWQATDTLKLTVGGRYDEYTQDAYTDAAGRTRDEQKDSKTTFRIGANKALGANLNLRASAAQGYRVPDIRELYIQKQTPAGVQLGAATIDTARGKTAYNLQPESTNAFEIGLNGKRGKLDYDVAVFHNGIQDRIEQVQVGTTPATAYYTFQNVSKAKTQGVETNLKYAFTGKLKGKLAWSELDSENKQTGKPLEFTPERTVSVGVDWQARPRLNLGADVTHVGKQHYTDTGVGKSTARFNMLNVNGSYALDNKKRWEVFGGIRNLTDEKVEKKLGSDPGRFVTVGLRANF